MSAPLADDFAAIAARLAEIKPQPQPMVNKPKPTPQEITERAATELLREVYLATGRAYPAGDHAS